MNFNNNHDLSWMDKDFMSNNFKKDTYVSPLADDTAIPCDACPMKAECEVSGKECVALRGWYNDGKDYTVDKKTGVSNLGRLLR